MNWLDIVAATEGLKRLFPDQPPDLSNVRLHEVTLQQDGPRVTLRLDLAEFPSNPPFKWATSRHNCVQITLVLLGIVQIHLDRWSTNNLGALAIERRDDGTIDVAFNAPDSRFHGQFEHIRLGELTAYTDSMH